MKDDGNGDRPSSAFEDAKRFARKSYAGVDLRAMVEAMKEWREAKDEAERKLLDINANLDVLRFELVPEKMEELGIENIRYDGIGRVSLTADLFVATKPGMKEELFDWLRKRKLGDLIQPGVNSSTLKAFVKDRMKKGEEVPSECLSVTPITRASITKA